MALKDPDQLKLLKKSKSSKYHAQRVWLAGFNFDSKAEAARWIVLQSMQKQMRIRKLEVKPVFKLKAGKIKYIADFRYFDVETGKVVVEDCKGILTPVFRLKQKLMKWEKKIEIRITHMDAHVADALIAGYRSSYE